MCGPSRQVVFHSSGFSRQVLLYSSCGQTHPPPHRGRPTGDLLFHNPRAHNITDAAGCGPKSVHTHGRPTEEHWPQGPSGSQRLHYTDLPAVATYQKTRNTEKRWVKLDRLSLHANRQRALDVLTNTFPVWTIEYRGPSLKGPSCQRLLKTCNVVSNIRTELFGSKYCECS